MAGFCFRSDMADEQIRIIDNKTGEIVSGGTSTQAEWYANLVDDCKAIITEGTFNS